MPRGNRPSIAAFTNVGDRKASEIVMLTCRTLHFSRAAICSTSASMAGLKTQRHGQIGVNIVERLVLRDWKSRWQQIDSQNYDGVDVLIFLEHKSSSTGQIIFAQIKCQSARVDTNKRICLGVDQERLARIVDRWHRVIGAVILVHVDPNTLEARWVNLRDEQAVVSTQIYVPLDQSFNKEARKQISVLCGNLYRDLRFDPIHTVAADFSHLLSSARMQSSAR